MSVRIDDEVMRIDKASAVTYVHNFGTVKRKAERKGNESLLSRGRENTCTLQ
jgi:hypothetical protein